MQTEYSYANAVECSAGEVERMILRVVTNLRASEKETDHTYYSTGDTFIHGYKHSDGTIEITDCKVRRTLRYSPK